MIKGLVADLFVSIYILSTLLVRFIIEPSLSDHPIISVALGFVMILFLVALIKTNVISPDYFGLLKKDNQQPKNDNQEPEQPVLFI